MKALKKLLALLLALAMVLAMAACDFGSSDGDDEDDKDDKKSSKSTYETPLKLEVATENTDDFDDLIENRIAQLNGLCQDEYEVFLEIVMKTDYSDEDTMRNSFEEKIEEMEDTYGKNWECSYEINDKEEIDEDDLEEYQDEIRSAAENSLETLEDITDDDIEKIAEQLGISTKDAEKYVGCIIDICEIMADIEITEGYELDVTFIMEGSEDEEERDKTYVVYKVNGCWVSEDVVSMLNDLTNQI